MFQELDRLLGAGTTRRRAKRTKRRKARSSRRWIQRAIKRPGALTRWLKAGGARIVAAATRKPVWTKSGEINTNTLKSFRKTEAYERLPARIKRRINLAITLERLSKK